MMPNATFTSLFTTACLSLLGLICATAESSTAATVSGSIDWNIQTGVTPTVFSYSLNVYDGFDPDVAGTPGNATYKTNVAAMKAGIIRYHYGGQTTQDSRVDSRAWVTSPATARYKWDRKKINNALLGSYEYGPEIIMNIANWPTYLAISSSNYQLSSSHYADYANFCASLVRIINKDPQHPDRHVQRWEVFNELDNGDGVNTHGIYEGFDGLAAVGRIFNRVAAAMKAVDPTILVGGPAFAREDVLAQVDGFFSTAASSLDFVSYHSYYAGTSCGFNPTNQQVFDNAATLGSYTAGVKAEFAKYSSRLIEYFHDEFNISYCPPDDRMTNEIGAVYDGLTLLSIAKAGATGALAWNEADGWYGKLDSAYNRRPASYLFQFYNEDMSGPYMVSTSSDDSKVAIQGVKNDTYDKICLINRSEAEQSVQLSFSGFSSGINQDSLFALKQVYAYGALYGSVTYGTLTSPGGLTLPANTVTILVINDTRQ